MSAASDVPEFSIIMPFRNALPELRRCLDGALEAAEAYGSAEVITVDNGSTDGSADMVRADGRARLISRPGKTIGGVRNAGAAQARGRYLYFLDADCLVPPDQLERARQVFARTSCDATGCRVGLSPRPTWVERTWVNMHRPTSDGARTYINSGNLFVEASAFRSVGGFDEQLITGEDAELGLALRRRGYRIYEDVSLEVAHLRNPRTLKDFLGKEIWHGLGLEGTLRGLALDRPTWMLLVHVLLIAAAVAAAVLTPLHPAARVGLVVGANLAVPLATVLYRYVRNRVVVNPLAGLALYWLYYLARAVAVCRFLVARLLRRGA